MSIDTTEDESMSQANQEVKLKYENVKHKNDHLMYSNHNVSSGQTEFQP